jgi:hypothetical protein
MTHLLRIAILAALTTFAVSLYPAGQTAAAHVMPLSARTLRIARRASAAKLPTGRITRKLGSASALRSRKNLLKMDLNQGGGISG